MFENVLERASVAHRRCNPARCPCLGNALDRLLEHRSADMTSQHRFQLLTERIFDIASRDRPPGTRDRAQRTPRCGTRIVRIVATLAVRVSGDHWPQAFAASEKVLEERILRMMFFPFQMRAVDRESLADGRPEFVIDNRFVFARINSALMRYRSGIEDV